MVIKEVVVKNFKGFEGEHVLKFDKNLLFFVGNNNTGKSTVFEAIDFLVRGLGKRSISDIKNKNTTDSDFTEVTVKLQGSVREVIESFSEKKYLDYVFEEDGIETLLVKRSSEIRNSIQGKKTIPIDIKKITLWSNIRNEFENPIGKDSFFNILEIQPIWADTSQDDITDFGSTKVCGRLLNGAVGDFFQSDQWDSFQKIHDQTFHSGEDCLKVRAKKLEDEIHDIIADQYGEVGIGFNFELPDTTNFIKAGYININDGSETSSKQKGTGLQRALAIALIQAYANRITKHPEDSSKVKPLFLFIDEPETFLHPIAQQKLLRALSVISENQQVFVTTHSPYLLHSFDKNKHSLYIFSKLAKSNKVDLCDKIAIFGNGLTWGEINYLAFGVSSIEFYSELYGYLEKNVKDVLNGLAKTKKWIDDRDNKEREVSLCKYIRDFIHHSENKNNLQYTNEEFEQSIQDMMKCLKSKVVTL